MPDDVRPLVWRWIRGHVGVTLLACLSVALVGVYLVRQHTGFFVGLLSYAFILLCPLMLLFMHNGQGGHSGAAQAESDRAHWVAWSNSKGQHRWTA